MREAPALVAALVLSLSTCAGGQEEPNRPPGSPEFRPTQGSVAELVPVHRSVVSKCVEALELEVVCPELLPETEGRYKARTFDTGADYLLADISYGAPYPPLTERNAPPRFVHIVIKAGDLTQAFPFSFPSAPASPAEPPKRYQDAPLALGRFTWGVRSGLLVLAPKFPAGGIDGGHLIFRWAEGETEVAMSLHAWAPLSDAIATLRAIVMSID